jgi:MGT family glycosyltransferase
MRIAFVHLPVPGHVNPTLALTSELRKRGVELSAFASEATRAPIEAAGASVIACDGLIPYDASRPPEGLVPVAELLIRSTEALLPFMVERLRSERVNLVVYDAMAPWGRFASQILGLPSVCSTTTFAVHRRMEVGALTKLRLGTELIAHARAVAAYRSTARRIRRRFGVRPGHLMTMFEGREGAGRTLVYTSAALQPGAAALPDDVYFVGPSLPEPEPLEPEMAAWIDGRPLIYVSLGTVFSERPDFLRACLAAFADRDEAIVVSTGGQLDPQALGEPPPNAIVRRSVPQLAVLERTRLFVTHAGMNSASEALWHGVPTLLHPLTADQPIVAARLAQLGAGRILRRSTPGRIAAEADRVLAGGYAARARAIGESLRACPGPSGAADAVVAAARG